MNLKPFGSRVLVKRKADEKLGEIFVPESAQGVSLRGEVMAVGSGCEWLEVGDDIFFGRYAPFELPTNYYTDLQNIGKILIMNEEDVLCRIEKA
ncbi:MAG: co-chaperone GroES [Candidatus Wukongarchaeota archaeon]|nr:co-chaperone GroES [Candidatus Wukongarchaeota archaeon]